MRSNFSFRFCPRIEVISFFVYVQSRLSPFAYSKNRRERKEEKEVSSQPSTSKFLRWFSLIEAVKKKRMLLPVKNIRNSLQFSSELHRTLYGFIVFEVEWTDIRGINYFNELLVLQSLWQACYFFSVYYLYYMYWFISFIFQTDTSLAIEAKQMKRWEFDNITQAASFMPSWFSGTLSEQLLLKEHLDSASGNKDSHHCFHVNVQITSEFGIALGRSI